MSRPPLGTGDAIYRRSRDKGGGAAVGVANAALCSNYEAAKRRNNCPTAAPCVLKEFLTHLAVERKVSASSQNQAFNALLFLFRHVLKKNLKKWKDMKLRVQDLNFDMQRITIHDGKGKKDRTMPLPHKPALEWC